MMTAYGTSGTGSARARGKMKGLAQGKLKMEGKMKGLAQGNMGKEGPKGGVTPVDREVRPHAETHGIRKMTMEGKMERTMMGTSRAQGFNPTTPWTARLRCG